MQRHAQGSRPLNAVPFVPFASGSYSSNPPLSGDGGTLALSFYTLSDIAGSPRGEAARSRYMHSGTSWHERFSLLSWFRVGRKMRHAVLAMFTANGLNGRLTGMGQSSFSHVYREVPFRSLLEREAKRSKRSGHLGQLLLVYRTNAQGTIVPMGRDDSRVVIEALYGSLRATDCIGWYRDEQIVGALLTAMRRDSVADEHNGLRLRLEDIFRGRLAPDETCSVQIRICRHDEIAQI